MKTKYGTFSLILEAGLAFAAWRAFNEDVWAENLVVFWIIVQVLVSLLLCLLIVLYAASRPKPEDVEIPAQVLLKVPACLLHTVRLALVAAMGWWWFALADLASWGMSAVADSVYRDFVVKLKAGAAS